MGRLRVYVVALASLLAAACAIERLARSPSDRAGQVGRPARVNSPPSAPSGARHVAAPGAEELDLSRFRPLLAEDSHVEVRQLLEQGARVAAAEKLFPRSAEVTSEQDAERAFLAGSWLLVGGDLEAAERNFSAAATFAGPLRHDAALRAARAARQRGEVQRAEAHLLAAAQLAAESGYQRERAELSRKQGDLATSLGSYAALCRQRCSASDLFSFAEVALEARAKQEPSLESVAPGLLRSLRVQRAERSSDAEQRKQIDELLRRLGEAPISFTDRIAELRVLVDHARAEEAEKEAKALLELPASKSLAGAERCELDLLYSKALTLNRAWGAAADHLRTKVKSCDTEPDLHAAMLFNLGKFAAADGRDAFAITVYAELERRYPKSNLADDSRLRAARSHKDLGNLARFTELLSKMPEDYPEGDMTMEGVLELSLTSAERNDWGAASLVLERGADIVRSRDPARGTERSGAERYFWARSLEQLHQQEKALAEYEAIVRDVPLSYYMLHAYSRLRATAPARAERALEQGLSQAETAPFSFSHRGKYERPEFRRGIALLRVGELDEGRRVLLNMGLDEDQQDSMLWAIALLFDRAGDAQAGHQILRGRLTDWLSHYPTGPWRTAWEVGFPRPFHDIVQRESQASGVPEWLIYGVMREESTFDPKAESPARAYGLMQLIEPTARAVGKPLGIRPTRDSLFVPGQNIRLGSRVLRDLLKMFAQNPSLAIPAYNAGPGRPRRWLQERPSVDFDLWVELIPIRETRRYMKRVLASQAAYAFLYGPGPGGDSLLLPTRLDSSKPH